MSPSNPYNLPPIKERLWETFHTYYKLGFTTFGGPAAHIAILHDEMVVKREWVSNEQFTELFAICQALPGPASTELAYSSIEGGIPTWATRLEQGLASAAIGLVALAAYKMSTSLATDKLTRILALVAGSISALYTAPWLLPVMMIAGGLVSYVFDAFLTPAHHNWKEKRISRREKAKAEEKDLEQGQGPKEAEPTGSPDSDNIHNEPSPDTHQTEVSDNKASSVHGTIRSRGKAESPATTEKADDFVLDNKADSERKPFSYSKKLGLVFFLVFLVLLIASILVKALVPPSPNADYGPLVATFYFVGSIIFGGGPVIIPLLQTYVVDDSKWMTAQQFLLGLALIQSLPGPNFNFACFLGAVAMVNAGKSGVAGAALCFLAIFFPGLILKNAIIPFWQFVREHSSVKMVFRGVNACALGLVFSATWLLWLQVDGHGGSSGFHAVIASAAFVASGYLGIPTPLVIIVGGGMGAIEYAVSDK
ncbi:hypothetical protein KI688_008877 [Linnemannia hyalina]|uniref:Chromate transporter n=1 Tax=Linnemannia hyalina TaxID=64524 RepID=A0A9P7XJU8_9FUNG|nr:hypothetical protein KI688_008877 [Linnemannia hyalina]